MCLGAGLFKVEATELLALPVRDYDITPVLAACCPLGDALQCWPPCVSGLRPVHGRGKGTAGPTGPGL